jgi:hypothetical protein
MSGGTKRKFMTKMSNKYYRRNHAGDLVAQPSDPWFKNISEHLFSNYKDSANHGASAIVVLLNNKII